MYLFIGSDGKQYGPVDAETVRQWIREGRLIGASQAKQQPDANWRPLTEFPEFADLFPTILPPQSEGPGHSAAPSPVSLDRLLTRAASRRDHFSAVDCYARAWKALLTNFWPVVGVGLLYLIFTGLTVIGSLLYGVLLGGYFAFTLKHLRNRGPGVNDLFSGFSGSCFASLLISGLLCALFTSVGFVLCLLPGLYLWIAYSLAFQLAVDRNLGFWEAMETSRRIVSAQFGSFFLLWLLSALVHVAGVLALGVGVLVSWPLTVLAYAEAYRFLLDDEPAVEKDLRAGSLPVI